MNITPTISADQKSVACPKGHGFWDLSFYPWGGSFHRFQVDCVCGVSRIIDTYTNGEPRRIEALMGNVKIGIQL